MKTFLIAVLIVGLLAASAVGTLDYLGVIHITFSHPVQAAAKVPEGAVAVPIAFRRIPAYQEVTRNDLLDPQTGQPRYIYLRPSTGLYAPITNPAQIIGRVMRHEKEPAYVFTEADFFPPGTTPGDAAAVPPGKLAMTIDASKISGVFALRPGNQVDLVASQVIDKGTTNSSLPMLFASSATYPPGSVKRATFTVLVQNGIVITPVTQRQSTYMGQDGGLMPSQQVKEKPVQEIMIAVDPQEVPRLSRALAAGEDINCFLISSQPSAARAANSIPNNPDEMQPTVRVVEEVVGKKHSFVSLPAADAPAADDGSGALNPDGGAQ